MSISTSIPICMIIMVSDDHIDKLLLVWICNYMQYKIDLQVEFPSFLCTVKSTYWQLFPYALILQVYGLVALRLLTTKVGEEDFYFLHS